MKPADAPKDGHTRHENAHTQPLVVHRVFANPDVLTEGWYPVCKSRDLRRRQARSFVIGAQRVALYRGEGGEVHALDAFCPHMGADLANGTVIGDDLRCYFHHWQFDGEGSLVKVGTGDKPPAKACLAAYPTTERYGAIWVYAARSAAHGLPTAPELDAHRASARLLGKFRLYAHHHVMMAGGIDLAHFATVHGLEVDFDFDVEPHAGERGVVDWKLRGALRPRGWRARLGRWLFGETFAYTARVAGGSVAAITYGVGARFRGRGFRLPTLHLLWGCLPLASGVSDVLVFALTKKRNGLARLLEPLCLLATVLLLAVLEDDDVKAFPNMRFSPANLTASDRSVARFIRYVNGLPLSPWSRSFDSPAAPAPRSAPPEQVDATSTG